MTSADAIREQGELLDVFAIFQDEVGNEGPARVAGGAAGATSVYLQGTAYDKNPLEVGPKTFVDKVAIKTGEKKRLYESENGGVFERVTTPIDLDAGKYIVSRESPTEIAQYYLVDGSARTALTKNEDVTPDLPRAPKDRFIVSARTASRSASA